jgi:putative acetyltransferase
MIDVRPERLDDLEAIRDVNDRAFGRTHEGRIVDALRGNGQTVVSLVATAGDRVVGHIFFSPATLGELVGTALGPVAVLPEYQRQGIGSALVTAGVQQLKDIGCPFVVLVGHPEYYPRFGFRPASPRGIQCQWTVPDDVFMVLVLDEDQMRGVTGVARFRDEFSTVT